MNKPVILCIDDEPAILDALHTVLHQHIGHNYKVETISNIDMGLKRCAELRSGRIIVPLVLVDFTTSPVESETFLQCLHDISPYTLTIMLSSTTTLKEVNTAVERGQVYRHISKPWQDEDLILAVKQALRSYTQNQQLRQFTDEQAALISKLRDSEARLTESTHELAHLNQVYERFIPKQFLDLLGKQSLVDIQLGDQVEKDMTVLLSDIRGFTAMSETMTPQDNFNFINAYLQRMQPIITTHQGFIDKYIGDAIMALFPLRADDALQAAIHMLDEMERYNERRENRGFEPFGIGIGINSGYLMLGMLGNEDHMEGSVIADAVNLTARVESLTKTYGVNILITQQTYDRLSDPERYHIRMIDRVTVKGKTQIATIYEVFDNDPEDQKRFKEQSLRLFQRGLEDFHGERFNEAKTQFERVLAINPDDSVAQVYLRNCKKVLGMQQPSVSVILVVDDDPMNNMMLTTILEDSGYEVISAENAKSALNIAQQHEPHLVMLDIEMPEMDGFDICEQLKNQEHTQDIPIIFTTARTNQNDIVRGFELGAVDYIAKPFNPAEVLARLQTHLSHAYLYRQLQLRNVELEINNLELKEKISQVGKLMPF